MQRAHLEKILSFINSIGIPVQECDLPTETFIPGIKIDKGTLLYDPEKLKYPGDLLHEAGHIALMTPEERRKIAGDVASFRPPGVDDEVAVILWSYAALKHIKIPIEVVFHENGYKGDAQWLIEQLENKTYIGLPLLSWMGMCSEQDFPKMKAWMRTQSA
ncbi:hypothetical protein [Roseivirga pacifica]|uniref:hypothetical protein n=1 Tax=Roseivirga pacifica TaxID=1267423 RepID=UPI00227A6978|nr:hypothetical protein [Roseivirga pacifica]